MVASNSVGKFPYIKPKQQDLYLTLCGDSIFAFQNVSQMDELGVASVPPTCDKRANANHLWNAIKWGNAIYKRFDWGKKSLVDKWDNRWIDDSNAWFNETGIFKTEYIGENMRSQFPTIDGVQVSTKIDSGSFPYLFDVSETSWWQRNIPKRFSNEANASVQFKIPAGYSKFDFIYHAHTYGDTVTITTNRNLGIVKIASKPNSWDEATEANGYVLDTNMSNFVEESGGNDSYGIPNMRAYFQISDTSQDTIVTITKTADTSKYFIYWGITYWGTSELPYALHINNMAIGGYTQQAIWAIRSSMFKFVHCDAIVLETCYNNLAGSSIYAYRTVLDYMGKLKQYFTDSLRLDISEQVGMWIPHTGVTSLRDYPDVAQINNQGTERGLIELGFNVIANFKKLIQDVNDVFYNKTQADMMQALGDVHLNFDGQEIYGAGWETLR